MYKNNSSRRRSSEEEEKKGLVWKLPELRLKEFGKLGPAFGFGGGCGLGFGVGLLGGIGVGPGIPGLQVGFGFGAGCGLGFGFGYGIGRGVALDDNRRYSNVSNSYLYFPNLPTRYEVGVLVDDIIANAKKLVKSTSKEIDKLRR